MPEIKDNMYINACVRILHFPILILLMAPLLTCQCFVYFGNFGVVFIHDTTLLAKKKIDTCRHPNILAIFKKMATQVLNVSVIVRPRLKFGSSEHSREKAMSI